MIFDTHRPTQNLSWAANWEKNVYIYIYVYLFLQILTNLSTALKGDHYVVRLDHEETQQAGDSKNKSDSTHGVSFTHRSNKSTKSHF